MDVIEFWHWWVLGTALIILEILVPGTFFLWMGVSAGAVGVALWLIPGMEWEWQLLLFAVLSIASIAAWRLRQRKHPTKTEDENVNHRAKRYIDRTFTLSEPIVNGVGKIIVDDSRWEINGPDCGTNQRVKVISVNGMVLIVELVDSAA